MPEFGGVMGDIFTGLYNNWEQGNRQEDAQNFAQGEGATSRAFNAQEAALQRDWEAHMSNTAMTRRVADLKTAGINPLLAVAAGGASTPSGAVGTSSPASAGIAGNLPFHSISAGMGTASQISVNEANIRNIEQETKKKEAEEAEIRARTPTHAVSIQQMEQNIQQSKTLITKMLQETETSAATAHNLSQQTKNLTELVPQIQATVENIRAATKLHGAQTTLAGAQTGLAGAQTGQAKATEHREVAATGEIAQRTAANLPKLEAALKDLERIQRDMQMPQRQMDESTHGSYLGALSATIRALTGLGAITRH